MESPDLDISNSADIPANIFEGLQTDWLLLEGEIEGPGSFYDHQIWPRAAEESAGYLWERDEALRSNEDNELVCVEGDNSHGEPDGSEAIARPLLLIAESSPLRFITSIWAASMCQWDIALANPNWGLQEWRSVRSQIQPNEIWADADLLNVIPCSTQLSSSRSASPQVLIATGGTSGRVKFIRHTWKTLLAAVHSFRRRFAPNQPIDSYCVLPLYHVSGFMQLLRTATTRGQLALAPSKHLESNQLANYLPFAFRKGISRGWETVERPPFQTISLVPTQLQRMLKAGKASWLAQFDAVFLGGAPAWPQLLDLAQQNSIPLSLSYGMTETAAMVTALEPHDFLKGDRSSGQPLPHATLNIIKGNRTDGIGRISIHAASIPTLLSPDQTLLTDDLGYFDANGRLHITGRASQTIISGGENVSPAEVEAAIRATGKVADVCVVGVPNAEWGEAIAALYVPNEEITITDLRQALRQQNHKGATPLLSRYKHPKYWIATDALPRNAQGKLSRQEVLNLVQTEIQARSASQSNRPTQ